MSDLSIILEIWEYFAKLLPLDEYLIMNTFMQGNFMVYNIHYNNYFHRS